MELDANGDDEGNDSALRHAGEERGFQDFLAMDCSYVKGAAYEIRSVVNHIGSSASCGHYTADAKRRNLPSKSSRNEIGGETSGSDSGHAFDGDRDGIIGDREWIRFNDEYVSKISSEDAVENASQTAYMIMYELVQ